MKKDWAHSHASSYKLNEVTLVNITFALIVKIVTTFPDHITWNNLCPYQHIASQRKVLKRPNFENLHPPRPVKLGSKTNLLLVIS